MKLTYYGTAAGEGWPGLFCNCDLCNAARKLKGKNIRTRSQALINDDLLIDLTPDTNMHAIVYGLDLTKIENLLVTHSHSDHFNEMDIEMLREPFAHNRSRNFNIYGNLSVKEKIWKNVPHVDDGGRNFEFHYAKPFHPIHIKNYEVVPLLANHAKTEECLIYLIKESSDIIQDDISKDYDITNQDNITKQNAITKQDIKTILYAHDTGALPEETMEYLIENNVHLDLVSFDCTLQSNEDGKNHMGLIDAVKEKQKLISLGLGDVNTTWIVNHFSHNGGWLHDQMVEEAAKYNFLVSYDGMIVEI